MIEILLAWFILITVLLGMLALQIKNLQSIRDAYFYSVAVVQLESMAERLRSNSNRDFWEQEQERWNLENKEILPKGSGTVDCHHHLCTIQLHWQRGKTQMLTETIAL